VLTLDLGLLIASVICQKRWSGDASEMLHVNCTMEEIGKPQRKSDLSCTTGRKTLVIADIFSLQ
jgi:hypothetical protein